MKIVARLVLALWLAFACVAPASAGDSQTYSWLQYGADGMPHARVATASRMCPRLVADGVIIAMRGLIVPSEAFDHALCDAPVPRTAHAIRVGMTQLPAVPHHPTRIAVLGDTGCRIKGVIVQNCNDPVAWPFARIASAIARERPELIVHVGDYQYRESGCLSIDPRCGNTPFGDNWPAWNIDVFAPASPLFATAPILFARGNHEDCKRAGIGWSRYLAPDPSPICRDHEATAIVSFDNLRIANVDSANGDERNPDPTTFERDERGADAAANGRETWVLTHRPPLAYLAAHAAADPNGPHIAAILAGHIHTFAALPYPGAPPTLILGTGGDLLSFGETSEITSVANAVNETHFGYSIFERTSDGWNVTLHDPDGAVRRRCVLRARTLHC